MKSFYKISPRIIAGKLAVGIGLGLGAIMLYSTYSHSNYYMENKRFDDNLGRIESIVSEGDFEVARKMLPEYKSNNMLRIGDDIRLEDFISKAEMKFQEEERIRKEQEIKEAEIARIFEEESRKKLAEERVQKETEISEAELQSMFEEESKRAKGMLSPNNISESSKQLEIIEEKDESRVLTLEEELNAPFSDYEESKRLLNHDINESSTINLKGRIIYSEPSKEDSSEYHFGVITQLGKKDFLTNNSSSIGYLTKPGRFVEIREISVHDAMLTGVDLTGSLFGGYNISNISLIDPEGNSRFCPDLVDKLNDDEFDGPETSIPALGHVPTREDIHLYGKIIYSERSKDNNEEYHLGVLTQLGRKDFLIYYSPAITADLIPGKYIDIPNIDELEAVETGISLKNYLLGNIKYYTPDK